ncbi:MAG: hypothetical protein C5B49_02810 [Bdellovibrio sp.]|nr:MAG: hypothetical protein C5B49_02810 [Bdellovibrio sp.]
MCGEIWSPYTLFKKLFKLAPHFVTLAATLDSTAAWARINYALKMANNKCTACHLASAGAGPKTLNGKLYGAREWAMHPFLRQSYAGADVKFLYLDPTQKQDETRSGLMNMATNIWASVPITPEEGDQGLRIVAEQNFSSAATTTARNLYLRWAPTDETGTSWLPQYIFLGRFLPPFGIVTDEHDTYVRMQTGTMWNFGLRMGALFSANPVDSIHYDIALLNGQQNTGTLVAGEAAMWGTVLNLRWMPSTLPFLIGASASYYSPAPNSYDRSAQSVYFGLSFERLTGQRVPVQLLAEYAVARNWNSLIPGSFATADYLSQNAQADSVGGLTEIDWDLNLKTTLIAKYDYLLLNKGFSGDAFQKYSLGVKRWFGPNLWFMVRYDKAVANKPEERDTGFLGSNSIFWTLLSVQL